MFDAASLSHDLNIKMRGQSFNAAGVVAFARVTLFGDQKLLIPHLEATKPYLHMIMIYVRLTLICPIVRLICLSHIKHTGSRYPPYQVWCS